MISFQNWGRVYTPRILFPEKLVCILSQHVFSLCSESADFIRETQETGAASSDHKHLSKFVLAQQSL